MEPLQFINDFNNGIVLLNRQVLDSWNDYRKRL